MTISIDIKRRIKEQKHFHIFNWTVLLSFCSIVPALFVFWYFVVYFTSHTHNWYIMNEKYMYFFFLYILFVFLFCNFSVVFPHFCTFSFGDFFLYIFCFHIVHTYFALSSICYCYFGFGLQFLPSSWLLSFPFCSWTIFLR